MIPVQFDYAVPATLDEALASLAATPGARAIAGGQTLLSALKSGSAAPAVVVDISRLAGLAGIATTGSTLDLGALTRLSALADGAGIPVSAHALIDAARSLADPQVRNAATLGGSLASNEAAADVPVALLALGASVHAKAAGGSRTLAVADLLNGANTTTLRTGELITGIAVPLAEKAGSAYEKFVNPAGGYALVGVAVSLRLDAAGVVKGCGVAVTGTSRGAVTLPAAEQALLGRSLDVAAIKAAVAAARLDRVEYPTDLSASAEYRAHLAGVLLERAARAAATRAGAQL